MSVSNMVKMGLVVCVVAALSGCANGNDPISFVMNKSLGSLNEALDKKFTLDQRIKLEIDAVSAYNYRLNVENLKNSIETELVKKGFIIDKNGTNIKLELTRVYLASNSSGSIAFSSGGALNNLVTAVSNIATVSENVSKRQDEQKFTSGFEYDLKVGDDLKKSNITAYGTKDEQDALIVKQIETFVLSAIVKKEDTKNQ